MKNYHAIVRVEKNSLHLEELHFKVEATSPVGASIAVENLLGRLSLTAKSVHVFQSSF